MVIQTSLPVPTATDARPKTNDDMEVGMTKIKLIETEIRKRPKVEIEMNLSKKSRTKGNIMGYSDDEQVDELPFRTKGGIIGYGDKSSVYNHHSMYKWKVPTTKVKLFPATPLGLVKRFRKIYKVLK